MNAKKFGEVVAVILAVLSLIVLAAATYKVVEWALS